MKTRSGQSDGYLLYTIAIIVYLFVITLSCLLLAQLGRQSALNLHYNAELEWSEMVMSIASNMGDLDLVMESQEDLRGVVIHDAEGSVFAAAGTLSDSEYLEQLSDFITSSNMGPRREFYQRTLLESTKSVILTKGWDRFGLFGRQLVLVTAEFSLERYWSMVRKQQIASTVFIVLFSLIYILGVKSLIRSRRYRKTLEDNMPLIQMGNAARTLSHEMKNPLSAIAMEVAMLRKETSGEFEHDLAIIDEEVERLTRLSKRMEEFLKNPLGSPEYIDVVEVITNLTQRFDVPISFSPPSEKYKVLFDYDRFRSVVENLIKNAIESQEYIEKKDVSIQLSVKGKRLVIEVLDRGEGISVKGNQIFDPFFTTKTTGTGIGLPMCKRFVEVAHGRIVLKDRPGGGTIARVTIPLKESV